jgi:hypothetical protein
MSTASSTATVTFVVTGVERIRGAGRLVALAAVEIDLEGVVVLVQGIQVIRHRGHIATQAPRFRDPRSGAWLPAVVLPEELGAAIAKELHGMVTGQQSEGALSDVLATPLETLIEDGLAAG